MSELILLKNKIRAIQNIQKITHTMQLIAMSSLTTFRKKEIVMKQYSESVQALLLKVMAMQGDEEEQEDDVHSTKKTDKMLCIIVGSQKGLCGSFNTQLKQKIREFKEKQQENSYDIAVIGNQAIKVVGSCHMTSILYQEPIFNHRTRDSIAEQLLEKAMQYKSVYVISNHFRTFFLQETVGTTLVPVVIEHNASTEQEVSYIFDEPIQDIKQLLISRYMRTQLSFLLYQSLLSESAARFSSMESATRNAKTLLEQTKTTFNKLRQAKITTEITELSANF